MGTSTKNLLGMQDKGTPREGPGEHPQAERRGEGHPPAGVRCPRRQPVQPSLERPGPLPSHPAASHPALLTPPPHPPTHPPTHLLQAQSCLEWLLIDVEDCFAGESGGICLAESVKYSGRGCLMSWGEQLMGERV